MNSTFAHNGQPHPPGISDQLRRFLQSRPQDERDDLLMVAMRVIGDGREHDGIRLGTAEGTPLGIFPAWKIAIACLAVTAGDLVNQLNARDGVPVKSTTNGRRMRLGDGARVHKFDFGDLVQVIDHAQKFDPIPPPAPRVRGK